MNVRELIEALEDFDPETEVRLAGSRLGVEYTIGQVLETSIYEDGEKPMVYLAEGELLAYLSGLVKSELGWS